MITVNKSLVWDSVGQWAFDHRRDLHLARVVSALLNRYPDKLASDLPLKTMHDLADEFPAVEAD